MFWYHSSKLYTNNLERKQISCLKNEWSYFPYLLFSEFQNLLKYFFKWYFSSYMKCICPHPWVFEKKKQNVVPKLCYYTISLHITIISSLFFVFWGSCGWFVFWFFFVVLEYYVFFSYTDICKWWCVDVKVILNNIDSK